MTEPEIDPASKLPEGDDDANLIYNAVGRAINTWEGLEEALARLYFKLIGIPDLPANLAKYGKKYRKYSTRMKAIQEAAADYFVKHPNQEKETIFSDLTKKIDDLSIDRHRIAHGRISMVTAFKPPTEPGTITLSFKFRWAAPFYSTASLRTDFIGKGSKGIDPITEEFLKMHKEVHAFTVALAP